MQIRNCGWMGFALACVLLSYAEYAPAATYYVSNTGADDAAGTLPETAWRSLDKVNSTALVPGDSVYFARGSAWRGQLRPKSGDETAPVTYGAYGSGEKPVLIGSVEKNLTADWVDEGGNIWSTIEPEPAGPECIANPDFTEEAPGWHVYAEHGAAARSGRDTSDFAGAPASYRIECTAAGQSGSDLQCYTTSFAIESGAMYRLSFRAKCSAAIQIGAPSLMQSGAPWAPYGSWPGGAIFKIGSEWAEFSCFYAASTTADNARLTFFLGNVLPAGAVFHLDSVSLRAYDADNFLRADVGNIIFDGEKSCGIKVWEAKDLDTQDEYWYDEAQHVLKIWSAACPAQMHSDIECALREHIIDQSGRHHVVYEGLALRYGAAHGVGGGNTHHITVRDCDLSYIGGGDQMGGDRTVRFGNGIEFWGTSHDALVERCRLWEIYDAALTNQSGGPNTPQYNITYRYNVIWNSEYSFEYWNRPEASETHNVSFTHNTCYNAGSGWGHAQRPDPSGRHLCFYTSPARAHDIVIRDNIFCGAVTNAFYAPQWTRAAVDALVMDNNCWFQPEGDMFHIAGVKFTMAGFADYQRDFAKEPHAMVADPLFVDAAARDFRLRDGSPCIDAGAQADTETDFAGTPVPQGTKPDIGAFER